MSRLQDSYQYDRDFFTHSAYMLGLRDKTNFQHTGAFLRIPSFPSLRPTIPIQID